MVKTHCKELLSFLSSAAHFYWHFRHSNQELSDNPASDRLNQKIEIQCLKIVQSGSGIGNRLESIFVPDSTVSKNFNVNGTILIDITDQETYYGFKIINNWESPLYAVLFYFGISDLEIGNVRIFRSIIHFLTYISQNHTIIQGTPAKTSKYLFRPKDT